jgi:hypothetical protein
VKLDKFTKVCINFVLILVIALLVKFLITIPKDVYAKPGFEYKTISISAEHQKLLKEWGRQKLNEERIKAGGALVLNRYAKKGWRLHSFIVIEDDHLLIFER